MIYGGWFRNKMEKPIPGYEEYQKIDAGKGLYNKYTNNKVDLYYEGEVIPDEKFKADSYCNEIFGKKIEKIGRACFSECRNLKKVFLPNVTSIGQHCFYNCINVEVIKLPKAVNTEAASFNYCSNLVEISIPEVREASNYLFKECVKIEKISLPKATAIGYESFCNCSSLKFLSIPNATEFDNTSFRGCQKLERIECKRGMKDRIIQVLQSSGVSAYFVSINEVY